MTYSSGYEDGIREGKIRGKYIAYTQVLNYLRGELDSGGPLTREATLYEIIHAVEQLAE